MDNFTVTIIGLGNIGMMYDYNHIDKTTYLSHFKSFNHHKKFTIKNVVDPDKEKLQKAQDRLGDACKYFESYEHINEWTDLVVLASLPSINRKIFLQLKDEPAIKLFLIEKPFWNTYMDTELLNKYSDKCYINYFRKSLPAFINLKQDIANNKFGKALGTHIWYSKGLRNNGSHMIDLMNYLFNSSYNLNSVKYFHSLNDYTETDLSYSFSINYKHGEKLFPVVFQVADERKFSLIEIDLIFENQRYRIIEFGGKFEIYQIKKDEVFEGYNNLIFSTVIDSNINYYGLNTCDLILNIINNQVENNSNLFDEHATFKVINKITRESNE
jgi:predicted dehydrogenase